MPYFKNDEINLLFIHIPKTGGTSLEHYLSQKYSIYLSNDSLYGFMNLKDYKFKGYNFKEEFNDIKNNITSSVSMQHFTYKNIYNLRKVLNIDFENNLKIISIVRNPYTKTISDLFTNALIKLNTSKEEVYNILLNSYINSKSLDNHNLPQYLFLIDNNDELLKNIRIFKTESLTNEINEYGYHDFCVYFNKNNLSIDYYSYLNDDSIRLINEFYHKDFEYFNYSKIIPEVKS